MRVTRELLKAGQSDAGGWSRNQMFILGHYEWPITKGWQESVLGMTISDSEAARFVAIRGITKPRKSGKVRKKKRFEATEELKRSGLPFENNPPRKLSKALMQHWSFIKRQKPEDLEKVLPVLTFIARSAAEISNKKK